MWTRPYGHLPLLLKYNMMETKISHFAPKKEKTIQLIFSPSDSILIISLTPANKNDDSFPNSEPHRVFWWLVSRPRFKARRQRRVFKLWSLRHVKHPGERSISPGEKWAGGEWPWKQVTLSKPVCGINHSGWWRGGAGVGVGGGGGVKFLFAFHLQRGSVFNLRCLKHSCSSFH